MLVTFKSNAYGNITMFGDMAERLIKMMGHSGTIPGAINAEDVPAALKRLKNAIDAEKKATTETTSDNENSDDNDKPPISLQVRAFPLVEMLTAASRDDCEVMWYK